MTKQRLQLAFLLPFFVAGFSSTAVAQVDDVAFANFGPANNHCLNSGSSVFSCSSTTSALGRARGVAASDLDRDGDDDLVFATGFFSAPGINQFCINDGSGGFSCSDVSPDGNDSHGVAVADLDGDGDLDFAFANDQTASVNEVNRVCLNNGSLTFSCSDVSADTNQSFAVAANDMDGDGDIDLIFADLKTPNRLCLNDGSATFTCSDVSADARNTSAVTSFDIDKDSDMDLVFSNFLSTNRICLNDGSAVFSCKDVTSDAGDSYGSAPGDFDDDGDIDLAFANPITNNQSRQNQICLNDGSTNFVCSTFDDNTDHSWEVEAGDLDGDGDLDLVVANDDFFIFGAGSGINRTCLNDGSAVFTCSNVSTANVRSYGVVIGNFDGFVSTGNDPEPQSTPDSFDVFPNPAGEIVNLVGPINQSFVVYNVLGQAVVIANTDNTGRALVNVSEFSPGVYIVRTSNVTKLLTVL